MPAFAAQRLSTLLVAYDAVFAAMATEDRGIDPTELDKVFEQLRTAQQTHWPQGAPLINSLGLTACDLLQVAELKGYTSAAALYYWSEHRSVVARTRQQLAMRTSQ